MNDDDVPACRTIRKLGKMTLKDDATVIANALAVYEYLVDKTADGDKIVIHKKIGGLEELELPVFMKDN